MRPTTDLVIVVPMLGRPHRVRPLLKSIQATVPGARVLFMTSPTDRLVHRAIDQRGGTRMSVPFDRVGDYARKINAGYRATTEPLIFTGADDLLFHPGWFEAAVEKLDDGIGVVGTNDLGSPRVMRGEHATHSLITRDYVDRFGTIDEPGKIYHDGYVHEFVDDELVGTAMFRGAWAFALDSHVEHLHPSIRNGRTPKAPMDAMYAQHRTRMAQGRPLYEARRPLWTA